MEDLDKKINEGYLEYLKLPLATAAEETEIYAKDWCVLTGLAYCMPHPHRHYTLAEFAYKCCAVEELYKRFIDVKV